MKKLTSKQKLFILPWIIFTALFSLPLIIFPDIDEILSNEMVGGVIIFGYSPMYLLSTTMTIAKLRWNKRQTILFTKKRTRNGWNFNASWICNNCWGSILQYINMHRKILYVYRVDCDMSIYFFNT